MKTPSGREDVEAYYRDAPAIVRSIDGRPDAESIYRSIYREHLGSIVESLRRGDSRGIHARYRHLVETLKRRFLS